MATYLHVIYAHSNTLINTNIFTNTCAYTYVKTHSLAHALAIPYSFNSSPCHHLLIIIITEISVFR